MGKDIEIIRAKTELANNPAYVLTIIQFKKLILELSKRGNDKASALIEALFDEGIERRFDTAFGKRVDEDERNEQLALRIKRLLARKTWTDTIKDRYLELYGVKPSSEQYRDWTVKVNLVLFHRSHFCCNRDNMEQEEQRLIEAFE